MTCPPATCSGRSTRRHRPRFLPHPLDAKFAAIGNILVIESLATYIPAHMLERSGKVFYSGRKAFSTEGSIYMIGLNPGGSPDKRETVLAHSHSVLHAFPSDWSAYRDESWEGAEPGTYGMAPRVLHLLQRLGLSPGAVPSSNLIFVRSRREADIKRRDMRAMADACWPFHDAVIKTLRPRVVLCCGKTVGNYVMRRLGASSRIGHFIEDNSRRWRSEAFASPIGVNVVVAAHPSRANWCAAATDVTPLVLKALQ